jgi:hypothetical protein
MSDVKEQSFIIKVDLTAIEGMAGTIKDLAADALKNHPIAGNIYGAKLTVFEQTGNLLNIGVSYTEGNAYDVGKYAMQTVGDIIGAATLTPLASRVSTALKIPATIVLGAAGGIFGGWLMGEFIYPEIASGNGNTATLGIGRFKVTWSIEQNVINKISDAQLDYDFNSMFKSGLISEDLYNSYMNWSTVQLVNVPSVLTNTGSGLDYSLGGGTGGFGVDLSPIGAFYESTTLANDSALSIANKTFRVLNSTGAGLSAAQLSALDTNQDGKLAGTELTSLMAWTDANEDGVLNTNELNSLAACRTIRENNVKIAPYKMVSLNDVQLHSNRSTNRLFATTIGR